jgi:hypothetical protein
MRYVLLIAVIVTLASTGVASAATKHPASRVRPGHGTTRPTVVPTARSWDDLRRELDPCHCPGGF